MEMEGLSVICADLGVAEEDDNGRRIGYTKSEYCSENLKDLLRFLRRDDPETREVFKQVCKWNIVSKDLIPIIEYYPDDRNLVLNAVKVLVFLTMPVETSSSDITQQMEYLWRLKSSIASSNIVTVVVSLFEGPLENLEQEAFAEDDWKLVQLVLTLFRNILAIQDVSSLQKIGGSAVHLISLRDRFLELLFQENVMDIFIVIAQNITNSYIRHDKLLLLEVFHYIFLGQDPELIVKAQLTNSKVGGDDKASLDSLKVIMEKEEMKRKLARVHKLSARHSQFSGTFTRVTMDGSKAVLKGNPSASENILLRPNKGRGAAEKIVWEHGPLSTTKDNILKLLYDFVDRFLSGCCNVLMQLVRDDIEREHPSIQNSDIMVFFHVAQFSISFQYHKSFFSKPAVGTETPETSLTDQGGVNISKGDICGPIAASVNETMFSLVISRWRHAFDCLKETNDFKFLSVAGSLMKTMIRMLDLVLKLLPEDSKEANITRILLYKLFYDQTDQGMCQFLLNLVKTFDNHKQSKSDLADLVETIHTVVRLMETLQARGPLRVSKKARKRRKKKASVSKRETEDELSKHHPSSLDELGISSSEQAVDFPTPSKEVSANMASDEKEPISHPGSVDDPGKSDLDNGTSKIQQNINTKSNHVDNDLSRDTDDSSDEEEPTATNEVDFKVSTFVSTFAHWSIIQNLCWLLKFYQGNSNHTNHHIICMLRRITDDLELSPMLYQLSLLIIFYKILDEQKSCPCKDYEHIVDYLTSLVREMLKKMKTQPLLFVEILFWKTRGECHYINAEYLLHDLANTRKEFGDQENISANGENGSALGGWTRRSLADALGDDEADVVISHDVGHQNEEQGFESQSEEGSRRKRKLVLNYEMEIKIKELYMKFKDDKNCSRLIAESLDPDGGISAAQVANKLKQLGLSKRKRLRNGVGSSAGPAQPVGEAQAIGSENLLDNSNHLGTLSSRTTRKRVSAFGKDQEEKIKELFEKFKDQRRCCHLIANALGSDKTFTAAQILRKLKRLGLRAPRQRKTDADMQLRDEEPHDSYGDGSHDSDNETLLEFKNRRKNKDSQTSFHGELGDCDSGAEMSGDSDDGILSAILKKKSKLRREIENEKHTATSDDSGSAKETASENVSERDLFAPSSRGGAEDMEEDMAFDHDLKESNETEMGVSPTNKLDDLSKQGLDDEFADSGDDLPPIVSTQSPMSRRRLKMVNDIEEDDD